MVVLKTHDQIRSVCSFSLQFSNDEQQVMDNMRINSILDIIRLVLFLSTISGFMYLLVFDPVEYKITENTPTCRCTALNNQTIVRRNMRRLSILRQKCVEMNLKRKMSKIDRFYLQHLLVDEKHKLVYCYVPKVATRSWLDIWLKLIGVQKYEGVIHLQKFLVRFGNISYHKQDEVMRDYTKFMIVREPFERLVSAFKDKMGSPEFLVQPFENISENIFNHSYKLKEFKPINIDENTDIMDFIKFYQFIQYFITTNVSQDPRYNEHWDLMNNLCQPCIIPYDVIGKYDTIEEDSNYVLDLINFPSARFPKHKKSAKGRALLKHYFSTIPKEIIEEVYKIMKVDFELFDYDASEILNIHSKGPLYYKLWKT